MLSFQQGPPTSTCRNQRHHKETLDSLKIPSHLEPSGLYRSDGKRPDGATIIPWQKGKILVWDATCPDTLATSHLSLAIREGGAVILLYVLLLFCYSFI